MQSLLLILYYTQMTLDRLDCGINVKTILIKGLCGCCNQCSNRPANKSLC
ncbi:unnamed protein product [Larinioides sclopetarius]|uniref:Uncharacterized protein n=1 Tax=Larinioides sclopetarius TaxID=280406 RepID=A0AAV1ZGX0_9ARAC